MNGRSGGFVPQESKNIPDVPEGAEAERAAEGQPAAGAQPSGISAGAQPSEAPAGAQQEKAPAGVQPSQGGSADGGGVQVRSPLYLRARLSGGFFSAVTLGMLLLSCVFSLTLLLVAKLGETDAGAVMRSEAVKYLSYLLYQLLYVGALAAVVFVYKEKPRAFGCRKTRWYYFLLAIALQFGFLFSLDKANGYFLQFLGLLGYEGSAADLSSLPSMEGAGFAGVLLVVAVLPALLEESIFRGVMLEGMKALGTVSACLLGGMCFSLFHQSPDQTVYQFLCGAAFTLLTIRADSLLPAAAAHLFNNAFILFELRFSFLRHVPFGGEVAIYVLSALCLIGSLAWLIFFDKCGNAKRSVPRRAFVKPALPGILVCAAVWVYTFVTGVL